jgi:hypothetical protein
MILPRREKGAGRFICNFPRIFFVIRRNRPIIEDAGLPVMTLNVFVE